MKVNNVTVNYNIRELTICMGLIRAYVTLKILLDLMCWPDSILETLVTAKDQKNLSGSLTVTKSKGTA